MTKYRAKVDVPPGIKQGDIVNFEEPLVDGYKPLFEKADGSEVARTTGADGNDNLDDGGHDGDLTGNLDRNALKERAKELGVDFAPNITTDKLVELVKDAEAAKAAE